MHQQWISSDFPRNFDAFILDETPYEEPIYFSDDLSGRGRDGIHVTFRAAGEEWTGKFPYGMPGYPIMSGLVSCPNPECVIVFSAGTAYYLEVIKRKCIEIDVFPAVSTATSRDVAIVCVLSHDRLACIDAQGIRWRSESVVPDDLAVEQIGGDKIILRGFDPMIQDAIRVGISTKTGALVERGILRSEGRDETGTA